MADEPETTPAPDPEPEPVAPPDDRFQRIEQQIQGLTAVVANAVTRPAPAPAPPPPAGEDATDDELFRRAQQGDLRAYEMWTDRRADRRFDQRMRGVQQDGLVNHSLGELGRQYPEFQDVNHPLTTAVRNKLAVMIGEGYPNNKATFLAAIEKTVASNRHLVSSAPSAAQQRQSTGGHFAPSHRAPVSGRPAPQRNLLPEELALARRIGARDPAGAIQRFKQRQASGQSSLGVVANFVREEDL